MKQELKHTLKRIKYPLTAIIRKLNIHYHYIDSDDLYQEALLYLWQQEKSHKLTGKNDSYILQGCYYHLKNYLRKSLKSRDYKLKELNDGAKDDHLDQHVHKNKLEMFHSLDEYLYYQDFNQTLSIKEKALLDLRLKGLTTREIGKELGISHTMVSKMRKKIEKKYRTYS